MHRLFAKLSSVGPRLYGWFLKQSLLACGENFSPAYPLKILGGDNIKVGNNFCSMGHNYLYGNDGSIIIGDNLSLNTNVQIGASGGKIFIGDNVLIGPNVVLRAADHGISRHELIRDQPHSGGEIIVENDVWIGANAVILKNVHLGQGCIVAAGAVVTKSVDPYTIVGGVPAVRISERF
ncbi:MAG: acyltransferase [Cyanobacteria bacterium J06639_16]